MSDPFIGIDFGTCNSSAALFNPRTGQAESLLNAEGDHKTPSVVYFGPNNEIVVGKFAEEQLKSPEGRKRVLSAVKPDLAKPSKWQKGGRLVTPLVAAAEILGKIKRDAEKGQFHKPVARTVITCPATFDEVQKDKLVEAAKLAGFREVELLAEPVAAALAYAADGMNVGRHVLVYDLGGGTFDLALLARDDDEEGFRVAMEPAGERIGGEDFDRAIYDHFEAIIRKKFEKPICPDGRDLHLLRQCRELKESLTSIKDPAPLFWHWPGEGRLQLKLTRVDFETLVNKHVERTVRLTQTIQEFAARDGYPLDSVILIGGASRTPCIVESLRKTLQIEPREWQKQDVAVALGAAYHAQRLWGERPSSPAPPPASSRGAVQPNTAINTLSATSRHPQTVLPPTAKSSNSLGIVPSPPNEQRKEKSLKDIFDDLDFEVDVPPSNSDSEKGTVEREAASDFDLEDFDSASEVFALDEDEDDLADFSTAYTPSALAEMEKQRQRQDQLEIDKAARKQKLQQEENLRKQKEKAEAARQLPVANYVVSSGRRAARGPTRQSIDLTRWAIEAVRWGLVVALFIVLVIVPFVFFFPLATLGFITWCGACKILGKW